MTVKVSVVIPVYNAKDYIVEAIRSILSQTYTDYEIIVVNDGSYDSTEEALGPFMPWIKYIYQKNSGVAAARNTGIRMSAGKYIAFLDADDTWAPRKLELEIECLSKEQNAKIVFSDAYLMKDGETKTIDEYKRMTGNYSSREFLKLILLGKFYICCSTVMFEKSCIDELGIFEERLKTCEDLDMWLRILNKYSVVFLNQPLTNRRIHSENITRDIAQMYKDRKYVLKEFIKTSTSTEQTRCLTEKIWANFYWQAGAAYYFSRDLKKAKRNLIHSLKYCPLNFKVYLCLLKCFLGIKLITTLIVFKSIFIRKNSKI